MTIKTRPATQSDFDRVLTIVRNLYKHDYNLPYEPQRLEWQWNKITLETDTLLLEDAQQILAYATIEPEETETFIQLFNIPQIDSSVLAQFLSTVENRSNTTATFKTRISDKNTLQLSVTQSANYKIFLSFLTMEHKIKNEPYPLSLPDDISIRTFIKGQDDNEVYQVDEAASLDKGYSTPMSFEQWSNRMGLNKEDFDPDLFLLACHQNQIVGVALNVSNTSGTWIDHLSVLSAWRKKGIGKALMQHSLDAFRLRGISTAKLNVDSASLTNAPNLYRNVGFETVQQYHWLEKSQRLD